MKPSLIPAWRSNHPLKAEDCLRWEEYLLSRHQFEGNDPGIEFMTAESVTTGGTHLTVKNIRGLTPQGHPVVVEGEDWLKIEAPPHHNPFDLFVSVHVARWEEGAVHDASAVKFKLHTEDVEKAEVPLLLTRFPNRLYLGRWTRHEARLTLSKLPLPRRLAALLPLLALQKSSLSAWLGDSLRKIQGASDSSDKSSLLEKGHRLLLSHFVAACSRLAGNRDTLAEPALQTPWLPESHAADDLPAQLLQLLEDVKSREQTLLVLGDDYKYAIVGNATEITFIKVLKGTARLLLAGVHGEVSVIFKDKRGVGMTRKPQPGIQGLAFEAAAQGQPFGHAWLVNRILQPHQITIHHLLA